MKRFLAFFLCFLLLVPVVAFAHPGNTDSRGGHFDRDTGEYHFHHGYPAHQHRNGQCPYDHDDRTGERSGSGSSGSTSSSGSYSSGGRGSRNFFKEVGTFLLKLVFFAVAAGYVYVMLIGANLSSLRDYEYRRQASPGKVAGAVCAVIAGLLLVALFFYLFFLQP